MLDRIELERRLIPAYVLNGSIFCWQCSLCHKLFLVRTETALSRPGYSDPSEVRFEFRAHDCRLQFARIVERLEHRQ